MKKIAFATALVALSSTPAFAANTDTTQGTATATVVAPITITHVSGKALDFGAFTVNSGGTVSVNSGSGAGSVGGSVVLVSTSTAADAFSVTGDASRSFAISTTGGSVSLGATSMAFTTNPSAASLSLSAAGTASFTVGGTLTVLGTEGAGTYTGTYNATVTYN